MLYYRWRWSISSNMSKISKIMSINEGKECIINNKYLWIYMQGDSLMRNLYYDLREIYLNYTLVDRIKTHKDLHHIGMSFPHQLNNTVDMNYKIDFGFDPTNVSSCNPPEFIHKFKMSREGVIISETNNIPNIWIYHTGLWDFAKHITNSEYLQRLKCIGIYFEQIMTKINNYTKCIMFLTPPYQKKFKWLNKTELIYRNNIIYQHNQIAVKVMKPYTLKYPKRIFILDANAIACARNDASFEGVHYPGVVSKTFLNEIFNLIC